MSWVFLTTSTSARKKNMNTHGHQKPAQETMQPALNASRAAHYNLGSQLCRERCSQPGDPHAE